MSYSGTYELFTRTVNLLKSFNISVRTEDVHKLRDKVLSLVCDFLLEVIANPVVLSEISRSLAMPLLEVKARWESDSNADIRLIGDGLVFMVQLDYLRLDKREEKFTLFATVEEPVPLILYPELRVNVYRIDPFVKDYYTPRSEGDRNRLLYIWTEPYLEDYIECLRVLSKRLPLIKVLREAIASWAKRKNVEIVNVTHIPRIRDVAKLRNTGYIIWVIEV